MSMNNNIYNMSLHEIIKIGNISITRVAGGWIYEIPRGNAKRVTSVFVPFNNEFMKYL